MFNGWYWRAIEAQRVDSPRRQVGVIVAALIVLTAAACTTDGLTSALVSTPPASVAIERIDGAPEHTFRKLVQDLSEEAEARRITVVSREGAARYRIRGYMAAHTHHGRTTIAWVWDIYDADQNRALRISGEEDVGPGGKNAWETDEGLLHRISQTGMDRIAGFLSAPSQEGNSTALGSSDRSFAIAGSNDDFSPESAGIFRTSSDAAGVDLAGDPQLQVAGAQSLKRPVVQVGPASADMMASVSH
jgi:hypothetical protein